MSNPYRLKPNTEFSPTITTWDDHDSAIKHLPYGIVWVDIVPEPDNPYDSKAISIRYNGWTIGYIARDDNEVYWGTIARVAASGLTAQAPADVTILQTNYEPDEFSPNFRLYFAPGDSSWEDTTPLVPIADAYEVPPAYRERNSYRVPRRDYPLCFEQYLEQYRAEEAAESSAQAASQSANPVKKRGLFRRK